MQTWRKSESSAAEQGCEAFSCGMDAAMGGLGGPPPKIDADNRCSVAERNVGGRCSRLCRERLSAALQQNHPVIGVEDFAFRGEATRHHGIASTKRAC